jgi:glycosyl transferase family 25
MIPALVISLRRAEARRAHIAREFEREGVPFEFVNATDGRELPPVNRVSPSFGVHMGHGDIACTMSHGIAMKIVVRRGYECAMIFEDDACLAPRFAERATRLLSEAAGWDVLKFSGSSVPPFDRREREIIWPILPSLHCQGYAITMEGARKLMPFTDPPYDCFDLLMQQVWRTRLRVLEAVPRLVEALETDSFIGPSDRYGKPRGWASWRRRANKARRSIWKRLRV